MSEITENVRRVLENVAEAAIRAGRSPEDITLVAATKMNTAERVQEAIAAGITDVGENRVQELVEKRVQGAYDGARLHFIGHLQKNKVKNIVGVCSLIQSVDSYELLKTVSDRAAAAGIVQDVLAEVNIGREAAKSGVMPEKLGELLACAAEFPGVRVKGLMCVPPICDSPVQARKYFDAMYKLFVDIKGEKYDNVYMCILSMGMSADYAEAIAAGADMVRVGSAIFGERHY